MAEKSKMRLAPPLTKGAESFISAAGEVKPKPVTNRAGELYPWDQPGIREDVVKSVNLRLTEPYIVKLQYLSEVTNLSQQVILRKILLPGIDAVIEQMAE